MVVNCNIFIIIRVTQYNRHNATSNGRFVPSLWFLTIALKYSLFLLIWIVFGKDSQRFVVKIEEFCETFWKLYLMNCLHNSLSFFNFFTVGRKEQRKENKNWAWNHLMIRFVSCNFGLWAPGRKTRPSPQVTETPFTRALLGVCPIRPSRRAYKQCENKPHFDDVSERRQSVIKAFCVITATETKSINALFCNYENISLSLTCFFLILRVSSNVRLTLCVAISPPLHSFINRPIPLICVLLLCFVLAGTKYSEMFQQHSSLQSSLILLSR